MLAPLLKRFATWALSKNAPGGYTGEDDTRWAYTIESGGTKYLTRVFLGPKIKVPLLGEFRVMLHNFHRPDADRWLHSHPWSRAASILLSGAYDEERLDRVVYVKEGQAGNWHGYKRHIMTDKKLVRWFNYLTKDDYHAVTKLRGDVWTLFISGPIVQDWGFLVDGQHVPWRDYLHKE